MLDLLLLAQKLAVWALPVLFTFTGHAMATAWVAHRLGDNTPELYGRLSLNPFRHVDPVGTLLVPLACIGLGGFVIGWPKRVPMDPTNFRQPRKGLATVSVLSMGSNLLMSVLWTILLRVVIESEILSPLMQGLQLMATAGVAVNLAFIAISLLPIPPLPAGLLLKSLLPESQARQLDKLEPYLALVLIVLIVGGLFSPFVLSIMQGLQNFVFTLVGLHDFRAF